MNDLQLLPKVKSILNSTHVDPLFLIKGDAAFSFNLPRTERKLYDKSTLIYEAVYKKKPSILKIYLFPDHDIDRYHRELYIYRSFPQYIKNRILSISTLYSYNENPLPYLILEKIEGKNLGSWCNIEIEDGQLFKNILHEIKS